MEKRFVVLSFMFLLIAAITLTMVSAQVTITKQAVSTLAIKDLNKPAIFNLALTNNGNADSFTIYSTVGLGVEPNESFDMATGETKNIVLKVYPSLPITSSPDYYSFEYKIKAVNSDVQKEDLAVTFVYLKDAFDFYIDPINPDSQSATVHFNNKYGGDINDITLTFSSVFFSSSQTFSLSANEEKNLTVALDKDKMKELLAGPYIVNANIKVDNVSADTSAVMKFEEKSGIVTKELTEGWFTRRQEISKTNNGNLKTEVNTVITKNLFAALFTTVNINPTNKEIKGFHMNYIYTRELSPGDSLDVIARTNWWILVLIIIAIILIWYLIDKYMTNKIVLTKRISFVRTKGGEFALKVTLFAKARDTVERIRIVDRLPPMVKVYEGYGVSPEKIDERNRRVEWNIQSLGSGEERSYSYIIYSKIGMVGKFELPRATAIYEYEGKLKEAQSNDAFFKNEPQGN